ncbi:uncharacterized protein LOC131240496 [Magnolia sinica]|uniref:uncharacterized protein LOC131240496 n=1 Tax=Magnolia sinica TaxID=86752 RepID=UPI00265953CE|nr:uncharacterized protein LOC131240496 [Magnolia sinica]
MNHHRVLTPGASRKRKERDEFDAPKVSTTTVSEMMTPNNRLLAGYLAHEFLTKGTLFGETWDPARAEAVAPTPTPAAAVTRKPIRNPVRTDPKATPKPRAYADVAHLLKTDGAHIEGIVNPTQLGRWLQM